jgi:basic membrane lipoprotein Med (substrate-binding protein (PBP1-ABC) superfamily)
LNERINKNSLEVIREKFVYKKKFILYLNDKEKNMKKFRLLVTVLLLLAVLLGACQTQEPAPAAEEPSAEEPAMEETKEPFRVAVVMPSSINDLAFSQSMYDALLTIQSEMGGEEAMEIVYSDGMFVVDDAAAAIRDYASEGYNLVIAHGSQYGSSLQEIAPDFPDTSFAWGTTVDTFGIDNIFAYEAASDQGGYVNGVLAASLSETGILGVVGPIETGDAKLYVDGFVAGAKATDPTVQVNVNYIGSFSDVALAAEAANTHIAAGADVLTGTAQMVVGAIGVAEESGALWFGTQSSQTELAPSVVVANQIYRWDVVLNEIIDLMGEGTLGGTSFVIDLANGGEVLEFNPDFEIPADVVALAEETIAEISGGAVALQAPEFEDVFQVAVVMPSSINDLAFSQSMYDALISIQEWMGGEGAMEFVYSDGMFVVDDAAAAIRDYAAEGFDLVIAHGSQYGSSLQEIAPDFPETSFAWGTTVDTFGIGNIFAYEAASHEGGYVNGVIAASLSESGVLGVVGPIETGDAKLYVDGFVAGAKATNPDVQVNVNYIGSFSDVALASEAANTHVAAGADGLTGTAQMVVGAIGVAEESGAMWFGTQASQSGLAPAIVVANQVYQWDVVLKEVVQMIADGTYGGTSFVIGLANGGEVMDFNADYEMPAEVKSLALDTIKGIIDGSITIEFAE